MCVSNNDLCSILLHWISTIYMILRGHIKTLMSYHRRNSFVCGWVGSGPVSSENYINFCSKIYLYISIQHMKLNFVKRYEQWSRSHWWQSLKNHLYKEKNYRLRTEPLDFWWGAWKKMGKKSLPGSIRKKIPCLGQTEKKSPAWVHQKKKIPAHG